MKRKTFLSVLLGTCGALIFLLKNPFSASKKKAPSTETGAGLDAGALKTLGLMSECIYPEDKLPGALGLGMEEFFRRQIPTRHYKHHLPSIRKAVELVDRAAGAPEGRPFRELTRRTRAEVMERFANGELAREPGECKRLFSLVTDLTLEGCFSHPRHGGNLGGRAWHIMQGALNERWFDA